MHKIVFMVSLLIRFIYVYSQINEDDSLAVRKILDANGLDTISIHSVIDSMVNGKIVSLNLYGKKVSILPSEIGHLKNLEKLSLKYNEFQFLVQPLWQLTSLKTLDLSYNQLAHLPPEVGQLTNLVDLNLRANKIPSLPPEIGRLGHLTKLDLGSNVLPNIPPEIGQLSALKFLNLTSNKLTNLPLEICNLTPTNKLMLGYNYLDPKNLDYRVFDWADWYDPGFHLVQGTPTNIISDINYSRILIYFRLLYIGNCDPLLIREINFQEKEE